MPLNFTILANQTPFNRDTVETCVKEVLQALSRSLAAKKSVEFDFNGIGRLSIQDGKVKMKFFREFILTLDSTGEMESAFRPDTAFSELSIMSRPRTSSTALTLPKIVELSRSDALDLEYSTPRPSTTAESGRVTLPLTPRGKTLAVPKQIPEEEADEEEEGEAARGFSLPSSTRSHSDSHWLSPKPAGLIIGGSSPDSRSCLLSRSLTAPGTATSVGSRATPRYPRDGGETRKSTSSALSSSKLDASQKR